MVLPVLTCCSSALLLRVRRLSSGLEVSRDGRLGESSRRLSRRRRFMSASSSPCLCNIRREAGSGCNQELREMCLGLNVFGARQRAIGYQSKAQEIKRDSNILQPYKYAPPRQVARSKHAARILIRLSLPDVNIVFASTPASCAMDSLTDR